MKGEEAFLWEGGEGKISQAERTAESLGWGKCGKCETEGSLLAGADCGGRVSAV